MTSFGTSLALREPPITVAGTFLRLRDVPATFAVGSLCRRFVTLRGRVRAVSVAEPRATVTLSSRGVKGRDEESVLY